MLYRSSTSEILGLKQYLYLSPVSTVIVLLVDHPLLITNEIQWHLLGTQRRGKIIITKYYRFCLKALFSNILESVVCHFAKSIRVTASMVCVHMPDHLS